MNKISLTRARLLVAFSLASCVFAFGQTPATQQTTATRAAQTILERDVRAHEEFLASDAMQGRGSGTLFELIAGEYVGAELRQFGIEPAGDVDASGQRSYIQTVNLAAGSNSTGANGETRHTYNAVGVLRGSDPKLADEVVLLTAHMDHLGVAGVENSQCRAVSGDSICNGADDDASGVTAVLELARVLGAGERPRRTVYFVTFGSEESGGFGAQYFLAHPPVPLAQMVANLEFEMIGRPDPKVEQGTLWLTGFERSNLGAELARHGARLVADPHPEQQFFRRSDNYALARRGVVAHTVSSFGLHPEYHRPQDDLAHLDIAHMTRAINSMVEPVRWLVNSDFKPAWVAGGKP
jgi:Zn-dependent M28 family amino/carboxypeptidase